MVEKNLDLCDCRIIHRDRVTKAKQKEPTVSEVEKMSLLFKGIGDVTRLRILTALEHGEMCVCDIAAYLGISESAVSHQLRILRQLSLVANRREGAVLYYRLSDPHVTKIFSLALEHLQE